MMKYSLLFCLFILCLSNSNAAPKELQNRSCLIVSDSLDSEIPIGHYVLEGMIYEGRNPSLLCSHVTIAAENRKSRFSETGYFSLILPISTSYVTFQDSAHHLSVFENYAINDQHRIVISVFLWDSLFELAPTVDKPVLYASSKRPLNLKIKVKPTADFIFTYPQLPTDNTWNVRLENQQFITYDGQKFPYLFWESKQAKNISWAREENRLVGTIVAQKNLLSYLDSVTTYMGFDFREKTDFITYWGPRLMQNPYNLIQFVTQEDCEQFAHYDIEPKPDHFNRFYMVYTGFSSYPTELRFKKQHLKPFVREGFYLVEWGGTALELNEVARASAH